jgi:hypothetical protein
MVDREVVEEEVVTDHRDGTGRGLIIGLIVALVIAAVLLVVFVADGGDDDGGDGGSIEVELPEDVDVGVEGDDAEG